MGLFQLLWRWYHSCHPPSSDTVILTSAQCFPVQASEIWELAFPKPQASVRPVCLPGLEWRKGLGGGNILKDLARKKKCTMLELQELLGWALQWRSLQLISSALKNTLKQFMGHGDNAASTNSNNKISKQCLEVFMVSENLKLLPVWEPALL